MSMISSTTHRTHGNHADVEGATTLPVLLTSRDVAHLLRVDTSTLLRWRTLGRGPEVVWLSPALPAGRRVGLAGSRRFVIRKLPSGRFQAIVKLGREPVASKTFDTKRAAQAYHAHEKAALNGGTDPPAGRRSVRTLLPVWLEERTTTVSAKTYVADASLLRLDPPTCSAVAISAITARGVQKLLVGWRRSGLAESSVKRIRNSLSAFFAWAMRERIIAINPVTVTRVPRSNEPRVEMYPLREDELEHVWERAGERDPRLADVLLLAAWTGLRWSELCALRVRDFVEIPMPLLVVQRAEPEGVTTKVTKSGKTRRVPVADRGLPIVRSLAARRDPDDLLCVTYTGHKLHATAFKRRLGWSQIGEGRRIHDLRHTAACLWLARGVNPATVQAWMGHASIATTNLYLHHLGTSADRTGLSLLNIQVRALQSTTGTPSASTDL